MLPANADAININSSQTKHLLSHKEFDILSRKTAFLSNVSRGAVIDQDALIAALTTGKLRGAALDVTDPEPLPPDNPLWRAPNVSITPHLSGLIFDYQERAMEILALNLEREAQGSVMLNTVNRGS
jgi:phosphoglycerate dehydrogenase-like enzyme